MAKEYDKKRGESNTIQRETVDSGEEHGKLGGLREKQPVGNRIERGR